MSHYELDATDTIEVRGETLYRMRATSHIPERGVLKGDLGGYAANLYCVEDRAWVHDDGMVSGDALVWGDATVRNEAYVGGRSRVFGHADICGMAKLSDNATVNRSATIGGRATISGKALVSENATVEGDALVSDVATVRGNATISSTSIIFDHAIIGGEMRIMDDSHIGGYILMEDNARIGYSARIFTPKHFLHINNVGSEGRALNLYPTEYGHVLHIGCWSGAVDTLMDKVYKRREHNWGHLNDGEKMIIEEEYEAILQLCEARVKLWKQLDGTGENELTQRVRQLMGRRVM